MYFWKESTLFIKFNTRNAFFFIIILIGVGDAIYRYYLNPSLWYDTAVVALNLVERGYYDLTSVLDYGVVAPLLFVIIEKFLLSLFSSNPDYGLRILPLICFFASMPLLYKVTVLLTRDSNAALISVSLFCLSPFLGDYSSEVKPYIADVLVLLFILYISLRADKFSWKYSMFLAISGSLAILLSFPSVVILFCVGSYLFASALRQNVPNFSRVIFIPCVWMLTFSLYYVFFLNPISVASTDLFDHWSGRGFIDFTYPEIFYKATYIAKVTAKITIGIHIHHWGWKIFSALYIGGLALLLFQRKYTAVYFLLLPLGIQLIIASAKIYPIAPRLMLYQAPLFLIVISVFFSFINKFVQRRTKVSITLFLPALLLLIAQYPTSFPIKNAGMKNSLEYIQSQFQDGDIVYVYHPAVMSFKYYRKIGYLSLAKNVVYGSETLDHENGPPKQLISARGRIWLIITELDWNIDDEAKQGHALIDYLSTRGVMLQRRAESAQRTYLFRI